jgi:hypothetical protein
MPSQTSVGPHLVPRAAGVAVSSPALQPKMRQGLAEAGLSLSSATWATPPVPSHCETWQSPAFCALSAVPFAVAFGSHALALHARVEHSLSLPGHASGWQVVEASGCGASAPVSAPPASVTIASSNAAPPQLTAITGSKNSAKKPQKGADRAKAIVRRIIHPLCAPRDSGESNASLEMGCTRLGSSRAKLW